MSRLLAALLWALVVIQAAPVFAYDGNAEDKTEEVFLEDEDHAPAHGGELHFSDLLNWDMAGTLLNFGLLVALIGWVIKTKGNPALADRRAEVEKELAEAQRLRAEAEARQAETARRLEQLDEEMAQIRSDMVKAGEAERDRIVAQAEEKAARMRKDASFRIEQQLKQLRKELTTEAASAAVAAARELLQQETTQSDHESLAESYLDRLDEAIEEQRS